MCTLTILKQSDKIIATMNRDDEKLRVEEGLQNFPNNITAPKDIKSQGSWIALNKHNVAAFLLNGYDEYLPENKRSRGDIVLKILAKGNFDNCQDFLQNEFDAKDYQPFKLLLLSHNKLLKIIWNGAKILFENIELIDNFVITSSSLKEREITKWRYVKFNNWLENGSKFIEKIPAYNLLQMKNYEQSSIMVERGNIATLSITQITISDKDSKIEYFSKEEIVPLIINKI